MTTVLLVRHGSHDRLGRTLCGRMPGVRLSAAGRREAERLAEALGRRGDVGAIYSSPLERARETAESIADALGGTVAITAGFNEIDFGEWNGADFDELQGDPRWDYWNRVRDHGRPPGGETMLEAQIRAIKELERLTSSHPGTTLAVVCHGDIIKSLLCWGLGLPISHYARFDIAPASVSRLEMGNDCVKVGSVNETPGV